MLRLAKKVAAGADFIQTQAVYDVKAFAEQLAKGRGHGPDRKTAILPGIIVPRSAGMLNYMHNNVPGVVVPEELIARMKDAADPAAEGLKVRAHRQVKVTGVGAALQSRFCPISSSRLSREVKGRAAYFRPSRHEWRCCPRSCKLYQARHCQSPASGGLRRSPTSRSERSQTQCRWLAQPSRPLKCASYQGAHRS